MQRPPASARFVPALPLGDWTRSGWLLVAGLGLAALGIALPTQEGTGSVALPTFPLLPAFGTSDSNGGMIAVTGPDVTGTGVLYVIDTESKQLACYQAIGGTASQSGVRLIGARRIDLDLKLLGFNDRSKHTYEDLDALFASSEAKQK